RLSVHVRIPPFSTHTLNLSREMGFVVVDDVLRDDTRYRVNLKSHLYSTVVHDKRTHRYQLLSCNFPTIVLTQCSEYWDSKSICPLTADKRRAILNMYNQWRAEDIDCVAISYVPVSHKLNAMFSSASKGSPAAHMLSGPLEFRQNGMLPLLYLVDDSTAGETHGGGRHSAAAVPGLRAANSARQRVGFGGGVSDVASSNLTACGIRFVYFPSRNMRRSNAEAIKRHLEEVDNVSLLVSLYIDNSPGASFKESNGGTQTFFNERLPRGKELPALSQDDMEFNHILNTLACSFRIRSSDDTAAPSLTHLLELIRLECCVFTSFRQMLAFIFASQLFLATLILAKYAVSFPLAPQMSCASIFWVLWVLMLAVSLDPRVLAW
ncbi:hypothetical protein PybrP1_006585, partial [[Pythium] brassicae (nom. inval.)]